MGSLYKRGGVWWVKYAKDGHVRRESSKSGLKAAARTLLTLREGDLAKGHPLLVATKTGADGYDLVEADYRANRRRSIEHLSRAWELHLRPVFGAKKLEQIRTAELIAYRTDRLEAGASVASVNRELSVMSRLLTLAAQHGWIVARPKIPKMRETNIRTGFFERARFEAVRRRLSPATLQHLVTLAYWTGWRTKSELLTLEWSQVDRDAQTLRLEPGTTKNAEGRLFLYGAIPELVSSLDALWAEHEARQARGVICPWVFARATVPKRIAGFRKAWIAACQAAGCPGLIPHDFRRTAVRNLVRRGVSEKVAMVMTGHKTRSVFDRYDIVNEADLGDAAQRYAGHTSGHTTEIHPKKSRQTPTF